MLCCRGLWVHVHEQYFHGFLYTLSLLLLVSGWCWSHTWRGECPLLLDFSGKDSRFKLRIFKRLVGVVWWNHPSLELFYCKFILFDSFRATQIICFIMDGFWHLVLSGELAHFTNLSDRWKWCSQYCFLSLFVPCRPVVALPVPSCYWCCTSSLPPLLFTLTRSLQILCLFQELPFHFHWFFFIAFHF